MNLLRRLFSTTPPPDPAIHLYVRCDRCGAPVHARIDPRNDLVTEYNDEDDAASYHLTKEMMDSRCFRIIRVEITYDRSRRPIDRQISGGSFIAKEDYDHLIRQHGPGESSDQPPR